MSSTVVPFTAREWQIVQNLYNKHGDELILATEILSMWRARQGSKTPVIFQITDHLLHIDRLYHSTNFNDDFAVKTLHNNYSTVLIRVINYMNEICQTQEGVSTIASAVATIGVPDWVVDLRHRAAHNHLPPLDMFKRACECLRELIWDKYWSRSIEDAMRWAVPKKVFEEEKTKTRLHRQKEKAYNLVSDYVQWKNGNPTKIASKLDFEKVPILVEIDLFIKNFTDTMVAFLAFDALMLPEEKIDHMGFDKRYTDGIWEIPAELQTYWADVIALISNNQKTMHLLLACLQCMYESNITVFQRKQLAGWVDLFLDMLLISLKKGGQIHSNETAEWQTIVKCILNADEDFKPSRAIDVFKTTKIFNEKKTSQLIRLTNLRARDLKIAKNTVSSASDDVVKKSLSSSSKNLSFFGNSLNESSFGIIDPNQGKEWCIADVDFSEAPLGLMPEQSSESLYLLIDD